MAKNLLIVPVLFLSLFANAQKKGGKTPRIYSHGRTSNKSFTSRLKIYPFNRAAQIKIVSFPNTNDEHIPLEKDTVNYSRLSEIATLTFSQIDTLTDILYNFEYPSSGSNQRIASMCYNPRNGILFIDNNGKTFEYIEVCFECNRTESSSPKIELYRMWELTFDKLKSFFLKVGIRYGTSGKE